MNITTTKLSAILKYFKDYYQLIVFFAYLILLATAIAHHEPWMDEAQAWLLAKDATVEELFVKYLRYEGSPGLWHLMVMVPAKLGLPYYSINILSAVFSALGAWLFLRYAPFPAVIKALYPFTFFAFFQYGVVARSYCMAAPLLFLLAMVYPAKNEKPFTFVLLLCILANISAHTFLIAASVAFIHFTDTLRHWKYLALRSKIIHATALFVFGIVALLVVYVVKTPPDQLFASVANWDPDNFAEITERMVGGSLATNEFSNVYWLSGWVSFAVFYITIGWLRQNKLLLIYVFPLLLLCILFAVKYRSLWHQGVLFLLWLFVLWISFNKYRQQQLPHEARHVLASITLVFAVQVYWGFASAKYDFDNNYSASLNLAKYINRNHLQQQKIYVSGWRNVAVLPYFSGNIFYNHNNGSNHRFWNWSVNNVTSIGADSCVIEDIKSIQPAIVIFSSDHIPPYKTILIPGYKATAFFKGYLCWKTGVLEPECYLVFRRQQSLKHQKLTADF